MPADWESHLQRWTAAGIVDPGLAERIRVWELENSDSQGLRWPTLIALTFGALLLGAGVLLFVSAHWDEMSSPQRMFLLVMTVAVFHLSGSATAGRFDALSIALHTVGTICLGAGIALAGQIFHLSAHWPASILLWSAGAAIAWALLRHWTQGALTAILIPWWLAGEWSVRVTDNRTFFWVPIATGICALSFTYLSARRSRFDSPLRKALGWIGGIALLPAAIAVAVEQNMNPPSAEEQLVAWIVAIVGPLALAYALRRSDALWNVVAVAWIVVLVAINGGRGGDHLEIYAWCALGSVGLVAWGIREARAERINLGILAFAVTIGIFYFSNVMDKLGRSASLVGLGLLFLGGGWLLEGTRRQLVASIQTGSIA